MGDDDVPSWLDYRAKRTEAVPDRSLFGSTMEPQLPGDTEKLKLVDPKRDLARIAEKPKKRPKPQLTLPEELQSKFPGKIYRYAGKLV